MAETYTLHKDLTEVNLHIPKLHASSHAAGGTDPIEGLGLYFDGKFSHTKTWATTFNLGGAADMFISTIYDGGNA